LFEGQYEEGQREEPAQREARVAYWNSPEGKLALRAQELSGDYGDVRSIDPKNVPAIENILKQIGTENVATKAMAATLAQKYGISDLNQVESRPKVIPAYTESGGSDESFYSKEHPEQTVNEWYNKTTGQVIPQSFATYDDGKATYFFGLDKTKDGNLTFNQPREPNARATGMKNEAMMALAIASLVFDWSGQTGYAILGAGDAVAGAIAAGEMAAGISAATGITVGANAIATGIGAAAVNTASTYLATGDPGAAFSAGATALVGTVGGSAAGLTAGAALTSAGVNPALASYLSAAIQGATSTALTGGEVDVSNMLRGALGAAAGAGVSNAVIGTLGADAAKGLGVAAQTFFTTGDAQAAIQSGLMSGVGSLINPNRTVPATYRPPTADQLSSLDKTTMFGTDFYTDAQGVRYYVDDNGKVQPFGEADFQTLVKAQADIPPTTSTASTTSITTAPVTTPNISTTTPIGAASAEAYNKTLGEFNALESEARGKFNEATEFYNKEFKPIQDRRATLIDQINAGIEERRGYLAKYYDINDPNANRWGDSIRAIDPEINALNAELATLDKTYQPALQRWNELRTEVNGYNTRLEGIQNTLDIQSQVLNTDQSTVGVDEDGALTYTPARFDIKNLPQVAEARSLSQVASDVKDWLLDDSLWRSTPEPIRRSLETVVIYGSRDLPESEKGFFDKAVDFVKSLFATGASKIGEQIQYFSNAYAMATGKPLDKTYANFGKQMEAWGQKNITSSELTRQNQNYKNAQAAALKMDIRDAVPYLLKAAYNNPLGYMSEVVGEVTQEGAPTAAGIVSGIAARTFFGAATTTVVAARALGSAIVDGLETFGANGREAEVQAIREGKTPEQARSIGIYKGLADAMLTLPSEYLGDKATFKAMMDGVTGGLKGVVAKYTGAISAQGAGEFIETVGNCATSWAASDTKDPFPLNSCLVQGWTAAMVAGGTTAGIIGASDVNAVIGKTKDGNDVTLGEAISGSKLIDASTLKSNAVISTAANGTKQTLGSLTAVSRDLGMASPVVSEFLPQSMLSNDLVIATLPGGTPVTMADMTRFEQTGGSPQTFMESLSTANPVAFANTYVSPAASATESQFATQTFFDNSVAAKIQAGASPLDATKSVLASMGIPASGVNLTALSQTLGGQSNAVAAVTAPATNTTAATGANTVGTNANTAATGNLTVGTNNLAVDTNANNTAVNNTATNNTAVTNAATDAATAINNGVDTSTATTAAVTTAVNNGASTNAAVNGAVTGAVNAGGNTNAAVNGAVTGATTVGADTNTAAVVATDAATNAAAGTGQVLRNTGTTDTAATDAAAGTGQVLRNTGTNQTLTNTGANLTPSGNQNVTAVTDTTAATNAANNLNAATTAATNTSGATAPTFEQAKDMMRRSLTTGISNAELAQYGGYQAVKTVWQQGGGTEANTLPTAANPNVTANTVTAANPNVNTNVATAANPNVNPNTNLNSNVNVNTNPNINTDLNLNPNINVGANPVVNASAVGASTAVAPAVQAPAVNPELEALKVQLAAQQKFLADQAAEKKAAEEEADRSANMKRAEGFLALPSRPATKYEPDPVTAAIIGGTSAFVSPLEAFSQMVQGNDYTPQQQQPEGALMQASPYAYGKQTDLNEILGLDDYAPDDETEQLEQNAKTGGLMTPLMAAGGNTRYGKFAGGGLNVVHHAGKMRVDFRRGDAVTGAGDGQSDDIPAMLADGEFVIPADVVAALGNGSTKAGSDALYEMMHSIRARARKGHPKSLPPPAKSPLDYISKRK